MICTLIYDLDGTILDSYSLIVDTLHYISGESKKQIYDFVINESVDLYLGEYATRTGEKFEDLKNKYSRISSENKLDIKLIAGAEEILEYFSLEGFQQHIFTHRGETTIPVLENLKIKKYFKEIITSQSGFDRKPSGKALEFIVEKYGLDKENTFYIGDRVIDVRAAKDAGVKSVLFIPKSSVAQSTGEEDYLIDDLLKLREILRYE